MADVPNRNRREAEIAVAIGLLFDDVLKTGTVDWRELEFGIQTALKPSLADTHATMYLILLGEAVPEGDAAIASEEAAMSANRYADSQSRLIAGGVVSRIQSALVSGQAPEDVFTTARADSIAVTETTAASSAGEQVAKHELETGASALLTFIAMGDSGVGATQRVHHEVEEIWITKKDLKVCPICKPFHKKKRSVWGTEWPTGPPAHPNDRCHLEHKVIRVEQ